MEIIIGKNGSALLMDNESTSFSLLRTTGVGKPPLVTKAMSRCLSEVERMKKGMKKVSQRKKSQVRKRGNRSKTADSLCFGEVRRRIQCPQRHAVFFF